MPYSAGRMLASKIAYSARNSAGRIYPSLTRSRFLAGLHTNGEDGAKGGKLPQRLLGLPLSKIRK